ncbi:MAG: acyclic terpene utilization AtuA family protein, partial [Lysobacterales bacterium]
AAAGLRAAFAAKGWQARIAVVTGDEVLPQLAALAPPHMFSGQAFDTVRGRMVFANAYLGARPIVAALQQGADIVLTGRVADAALCLAPLVHEFQWKLEDARTQPELDRLAQGLAVGHLLECSGQGSGGNFGSQQAWKAIPDLAHIGYPIAEVSEDGTALLTKAPGTGGRINFDTVRQQLLYEVHDPHRYLSPDVVLDLSAVRLEDLGHDRVRLSGARGEPRPAQLKVVGGWRDGYKAEVTWGFSWPDAHDKALAAVEMVKAQLADKRLSHEALFVEFPGLNSAHGPLAALPAPDALVELNEVWVRLVIRTQDKAVADGFGRLFPWMALSGPAYSCGFHGLNNSSELHGIWPALMDRQAVEAQVRVELVET